MKSMLSELSQAKVDAGFGWQNEYKDVELIFVNRGLEPDVVTEVSQKGFVVHDGEPQDIGLFQIPFDLNGPDDKLIYIQEPGLVYDLTQAWSSPVFFAGTSEQNVDNLVFSITSISKRVELSNYLEREVLSKHDAFFDSRVMGGPVSIWREYISLYQSLLDSGMIEHTTATTRNLCLNIFAATFPDRFKYMSVRSAHAIPPIYS